MTRPATETSTVSVTVRHIEPATGGPLVALASVEILIDGVALVVQGIRIVRRPPRIAVEAPLFRCGAAWLPAILFPDDLGQPLADAVLDAYDATRLPLRKAAG